MLMDADAFWRIVAEAGNVRAGCSAATSTCKHEEVRHGIAVVTTPSTCFQSSKLFHEKRYLPGPPALRLVTCRAGRMTSDVTTLLTLRP
jgi:hypothetical protein